MTNQCEGRLSLALDAVGGGVFDWHIPTGTWIRSDSWYELIGFEREELEAWEAEHGSVVHADDRAGIDAAYQAHVRGDSDRYHHEFRIRHKSGEWRWLLGRGLIVDRDEDGSPLRMVGTDTDITTRKLAEHELQRVNDELEQRVQNRTREIVAAHAALRDSEQRLRAIVDSATACVKLVDADGVLREMNPAGLKMAEADSLDQVANRPMLDLVDPAHREKFARLHKDVLDGGTVDLEFEIIGLKGTRRWMQTHAVPFRNSAGAISGQLSVTHDVTERKQTEERQVLLTRELNHRVKNNLAAISALAHLTAQSTDSVHNFVRLFTDRISSLARAHEALANVRWQSIALAEVVRVVMGPFHASGPRLRLSGPEIVVPAHDAQPLALVLHELMTNAARHGALSSADGVVEVKWKYDQAKNVIVDWTERDGPPIEAPDEFGLGLRLVSGCVEKEMGGDLEVDFNADGFRCSFLLPATPAASNPGYET